jgi:hypothetical protein
MRKTQWRSYYQSVIPPSNRPFFPYHHLLLPAANPCIRSLEVTIIVNVSPYLVPLDLGPTLLTDRRGVAHVSLREDCGHTIGQVSLSLLELEGIIVPEEYLLLLWYPRARGGDISDCLQWECCDGVPIRQTWLIANGLLFDLTSHSWGQKIEALGIMILLIATEELGLNQVSQGDTVCVRAGLLVCDTYDSTVQHWSNTSPLI